MKKIKSITTAFIVKNQYKLLIGMIAVVISMQILTYFMLKAQGRL